MDTEPENLQFLGTVGVVEEAFKILRSCAKLLWALTLTLILPFCFAIMGKELISGYLLDRRSAMSYQVEMGSPASQRIMRELTLERMKLFIFPVAYLVFVWAFSFLSMAAVVYTVASTYTGKEISYASVMSVVPRVWKRLMATFLWFLIIVFAYYLSFILLCSPLIFSVLMIKSWTVILSGLFLITAVFFYGCVYISLVWELACVISILEDKYGLGAMRKSMDLIKGKRITALMLYVLYLIFGGIIGWVYSYNVLHGDLHGVGSAGRGAYGTVLVGFLCFVNLMRLLTKSVFYFVCKSYHHESIDKSSLSDHLQVYHGDYEPLKSSNIELEHLHDYV